MFPSPNPWTGGLSGGGKILNIAGHQEACSFEDLSLPLWGNAFGKIDRDSAAIRNTYNFIRKVVLKSLR
jgi:hypothetical protein